MLHTALSGQTPECLAVCTPITWNPLLPLAVAVVLCLAVCLTGASVIQSHDFIPCDSHWRPPSWAAEWVMGLWDLPQFAFYLKLVRPPTLLLMPSHNLPAGQSWDPELLQVECGKAALGMDPFTESLGNVQAWKTHLWPWTERKKEKKEISFYSWLKGD